MTDTSIHRITIYYFRFALLLTVCVHPLQLAAQNQTVTEKVTTVTETTTKEVTYENENYDTVLFVENYAGPEYNRYVQILERSLASHITDHGFKLVDPDNVLSAVAEMNKTGNATDTDVIQMMKNQTSAMNLSQNIGVDYILIASINTYGSNSREIEFKGLERRTTEHILRASYELLDAGDAGGLSGDSVKVSHTTSQSQDLATASSDIINELIDKASRKLASSLTEKADSNKIAKSTAVDSSDVSFNINVEVTDFNLPDFQQKDDGSIQTVDDSWKMNPRSFIVELDGLTIGSTDQGEELKASAGIHQIRVTRKGFKPFERMISIKDGTTLTIPMQMTSSERKKFREMGRFFEEVKQRVANRKSAEALSEAEVKRIEGYAQMLQQSGYKIDVKVDTDEAPKIQQNSSILSDLFDN